MYKRQASNSKFYGGLFTNDPALADLRDSYSIPENSLKDPERVPLLNAFFFWVSWSCVTERPGQSITYTNNWPAEELVGNRPSGSLLLWTGFSVIVLIAGIGLMVCIMHVGAENRQALSLHHFHC